MQMLHLRHLFNAKPPFMSLRIPAFNEVNDWAHNVFDEKLMVVSYFGMYVQLRVPLMSFDKWPQ